MKITVKLIRAWGQLRFYPECEVSKMICVLMKRQSLTNYQINIITNFGFKLEVIDEKQE